MKVQIVDTGKSFLLDGFLKAFQNSHRVDDVIYVQSVRDMKSGFDVVLKLPDENETLESVYAFYEALDKVTYVYDFCSHVVYSAKTDGFNEEKDIFNNPHNKMFNSFGALQRVKLNLFEFYRKKKLYNGVCFIIPSVYGPGCDFIKNNSTVPQTFINIKSLLNSKASCISPCISGLPSSTSEYIYSRDLIKKVTSLVLARTTSTLVARNLGTGRLVSNKEIVEFIKSYINQSMKTEWLYKDVIDSSIRPLKVNLNTSDFIDFYDGLKATVHKCIMDGKYNTKKLENGTDKIFAKDFDIYVRCFVSEKEAIKAAKKESINLAGCFYLSAKCFYKGIYCRGVNILKLNGTVISFLGPDQDTFEEYENITLGDNIRDLKSFAKGNNNNGSYEMWGICPILDNVLDQQEYVVDFDQYTPELKADKTLIAKVTNLDLFEKATDEIKAEEDAKVFSKPIKDPREGVEKEKQKNNNEFNTIIKDINVLFDASMEKMEKAKTIEELKNTFDKYFKAGGDYDICLSVLNNSNHPNKAKSLLKFRNDFAGICEFYETKKENLKIKDENDNDIQTLLSKSFKQYPEIVKEICNGNTNLLGFFVGQVLLNINKRVDPKLINKILTENIENIKKELKDNIQDDSLVKLKSGKTVDLKTKEGREKYRSEINKANPDIYDQKNNDKTRPILPLQKTYKPKPVYLKDLNTKDGPIPFKKCGRRHGEKHDDKYQEFDDALEFAVWDWVKTNTINKLLFADIYKKQILTKRDDVHIMLNYIVNNSKYFVKDIKNAKCINDLLKIKNGISYHYYSKLRQKVKDIYGKK